jgi:hypothetical protein
MKCLWSSKKCGDKANLIGSLVKKNETLEAPKIQGSILKYGVPPLWFTYICKWRRTYAKAYGIKVRCYGENVGDHIGNLGT